LPTRDRAWSVRGRCRFWPVSGGAGGQPGGGPSQDLALRRDGLSCGSSRSRDCGIRRRCRCATSGVTTDVGLPGSGTAHFRLDALSRVFLIVAISAEGGASRMRLGHGGTSRNRQARAAVLTTVPSAGMTLVCWRTNRGQLPASWERGDCR